MRRTARDPVEEFEELRRLLLGREREQLRDLHDRIADKERRSHDVAGVLPEAVKMSRERGEELEHALRPAVEGSIKESIDQRPQVFVDALHPIIGPIVRRSIAESLRRLLQSLNQTLEHTFSWRGLKWRFEALRTGKSFAEVVMLRSLVYRVEQLFLIHRQTSLSLLHVAADSALTKDSDMVAGMLSAIQDFARDSFAAGEDSALEEFRVGELQVWIASGRDAYLAAVIRGNPSRELRSTLEETIESIHVLKGSALAFFQGDALVFEPLRPELESCLRAQYAEKAGGRPTRAWIVIAAVLALVIFGLFLAAQSKAKWTDFLERLKAQPGVIVTEARQGWFSRSHVSGLRDASSADPAALAREAKLDPDRIRFQWKEFLALDPASVKRRFEQRFQVPKETRVAINQDGVLELAGSVPYEWLEQIRREGTLIPGVTSIVERDATVIYDPDLARKRFVEELKLPDSMNAVAADGVLTLSGEASHRWLTRVRAEATKIPGVTSVDDRAVIDVDQRAFDQSKSIIESAFVYFLTNKDDIATEGFAALSRLPDEIRRCEGAARQMGMDVALEIHGYADAVGTEAKNADLRQRRANKVRDFLVSCGFEPARFKPMGIDQPFKPAPSDKALPEQSDRRVAFKVVTNKTASP